MIAKANFFVEHIRDLQRESKRDPILLERTLYAFGLLEALSRVGLPFIFKGGTSLMLLLEHPMRLSTDIDIVVAPDEDIDHFIREAGKIFPFASCEEQIRHGHNDIEKRHFKFQYDSPINQRPYIYFRFLTHTPFFAVFQNNKIASCWDSSTSRVRSRRPERFARTANRTSFLKIF